MARLTIRDIAREAGVSRAAVSFALNDRPGVSPSTRAKILEIAARMGWRPNATARALSSSRSNAIGLVLQRPRVNNSSERFFFDFITGVQDGLDNTGIALLLRLSHSMEEELRAYQEWWAQGRVDGVIVVDPRDGDPRPQKLNEYSLPTVVIGQKFDKCGAVIGDDEQMIRLLAEHLFEQGCRHIAFVCGSSSFSHIQQRITTLQRLAHERGARVTVSPENEFSEAAALEATRALLDGPSMPEGIIFANEILTLGGFQAIAQSGLKTGRDIKICSCEDSPMLRMFSPAVTAISRNPATMGHAGAQLLLEQLQGEEARTVSDQDPQLVARASTLSSQS